MNLDILAFDVLKDNISMVEDEMNQSALVAPSETGVSQIYRHRSGDRRQEGSFVNNPMELATGWILSTVSDGLHPLFWGGI